VQRAASPDGERIRTPMMVNPARLAAVMKAEEEAARVKAELEGRSAPMTQRQSAPLWDLPSLICSDAFLRFEWPGRCPDLGSSIG
jgi:hypothetical protein